MEANIVLAFVVGIVVLCLIGKVVSLPMRILWKLVSNSIVGAVMLWIVNLFGVGIKITFLKALIAGVFGIPGVLGLVIYQFL
jgi:inhibitor of the pro-sigma K processing machinery